MDFLSEKLNEVATVGKVCVYHAAQLSQISKNLIQLTQSHSQSRQRNLKSEPFLCLQQSVGLCRSLYLLSGIWINSNQSQTYLQLLKGLKWFLLQETEKQLLSLQIFFLSPDIIVPRLRRSGLCNGLPGAGLEFVRQHYHTHKRFPLKYFSSLCWWKLN